MESWRGKVLIKRISLEKKQVTSQRKYLLMFLSHVKTPTVCLGLMIFSISIIYFVFFIILNLFPN